MIAFRLTASETGTEALPENKGRMVIRHWEIWLIPGVFFMGVPSEYYHRYLKNSMSVEREIPTTVECIKAYAGEFNVPHHMLFANESAIYRVDDDEEEDEDAEEDGRLDEIELDRIFNGEQRVDPRQFEKTIEKMMDDVLKGTSRWFPSLNNPERRPGGSKPPFSFDDWRTSWDRPWFVGGMRENDDPNMTNLPAQAKPEYPWAKLPSSVIDLPESKGDYQEIITAVRNAPNGTTIVTHNEKDHKLAQGIGDANGKRLKYLMVPLREQESVINYPTLGIPRRDDEVVIHYPTEEEQEREKLTKKIAEGLSSRLFNLSTGQWEDIAPPTNITFDNPSERYMKHNAAQEEEKTVPHPPQVQELRAGDDEGGSDPGEGDDNTGDGELH